MSEHKILARVPISVRWRDMDSMGHVNNAKYISYLEEARVRWMLGVEGVAMTDRIAPVVAATNVNYKRPLVWPNDILVELFVERLGSSSVTIGIASSTRRTRACCIRTATWWWCGSTPRPARAHRCRMRCAPRAADRAQHRRG